MNRLVDFHESCYEGNAIKGTVEALIIIPIASTILKWLMFKLRVGCTIFKFAQQ
jgi:hypothetical protein